MWSGSNVVGLRRRWASRERDPGRSARRQAGGRDYDPATGRSAYTESVRPAFLARDIVIDCPHPDCHGLLPTGQRAFGEAGGTASQVVLRCTREPEDHEIAIWIEPYSLEERERLKQAHLEGKPLACARCGTSLKLGTVAIADEWTESVSREEAYFCPWCGVKWPLPGELKCQQPG